MRNSRAGIAMAAFLVGFVATATLIIMIDALGTRESDRRSDYMFLGVVFSLMLATACSPGFLIGWMVGGAARRPLARQLVRAWGFTAGAVTMLIMWGLAKLEQVIPIGVERLLFPSWDVAGLPIALFGYIIAIPFAIGVAVGNLAVRGPRTRGPATRVG